MPSSKGGFTRNGMNTGVVIIPILDRGKWLPTAYLLVNNINASFPFSSMSGRLAVGSLNLAQQLSAKAIAASHESVDL